MEQKDVTGEKYNKLLITGLAPSKREPSGTLVKRVYTLCDCGITGEKSYKEVKRGKIKSCGCLTPLPTKVEPGDKYGFWEVVKETEGYFLNGEKEDRTFLCKCICGKEKEVNLQSLKRGDSKSCGCKGKPRQEKVIKKKVIPQDTTEEQWKECISYPGYYISTMGNLFGFKSQNYFKKTVSYSIGTIQFLSIKEMYKTFIGNYDESIYNVCLEGAEIKLEKLFLKETRSERRKKLNRVYGGIKERCNNPNSKDYKNYGGRGITIEESFSTFDKFFDWAIYNGYEIGLQIDRENNDGNYSSNNCRFTTHAENCRNMRRNVMSWELVTEIRSEQYIYLSDKELAELVGCNPDTIGSVRNYKTWVAE